MLEATRQRHFRPPKRQITYHPGQITADALLGHTQRPDPWPVPSASPSAGLSWRATCVSRRVSAQPSVALVSFCPQGNWGLIGPPALSLQKLFKGPPMPWRPSASLNPWLLPVPSALRDKMALGYPEADALQYFFQVLRGEAPLAQRCCNETCDLGAGGETAEAQGPK